MFHAHEPVRCGGIERSECDARIAFVLQHSQAKAMRKECRGSCDTFINVLIDSRVAAHNVRGCSRQMEFIDVQTSGELMRVNGVHAGELLNGS